MYLLLRNNKQSGPYSLEELKSMGLKAYDLVWLEGKSAAWRYPSELEELKPFAPAVEEQPFDRFYRRPASATTTATNAIVATLNTQAPAADAPVPVTVESAKAPGKRIIYVTMPAARNASAVAPQPAVPRPEPVREAVQPAAAARETAQPVREHTPRVIEDYPAHETGDRATVEDFFPRNKRSPRAIRLLTIAICILALLAVGIIIGLNLNKDTLGFSSREVAKVPPGANLSSGNPDQTIVHPTAQRLPAPAATAPALTTDSAPAIVDAPVAAPPAVAKATTKTPGIRTQKERPSRQERAFQNVKANSLPPAKIPAGESIVANAVHRADIAEPYHNNTELADKEAIKAALASQVSVGANGYSVGTFGGITDLQLTVTNRSVYPLDLVIVEVQYIQANKKVFKTQDLYFHGIGAGSALMQEAPKSSRGVRVQYKIMSITSKEVAYSYTGI